MAKKTGNPGYGPEEKAAVIYLKAEGHSDRTIGAMGTFTLPNKTKVKLPDRSTIEDWNDEKSPRFDAVFSRQYARACEDNLWSEHEKLREINRKLEAGLIDASAANVMSGNIKWDLARRLRHIFGDRVTHEGGDKPIKTESQVTFYMPEKAPHE